MTEGSLSLSLSLSQTLTPSYTHTHTHTHKLTLFSPPTHSHTYKLRVREMVVGSSIDKVYMVMDFGGMDLKVKTHLI